MAVHRASAFPNECVAVITEAAQAFVEARTLEGIEVAQRNFKDPLQFAKIEKYHGAKARWVLEAWTDIWLSSEFATWSLESALPQVTSPLLAIHGEQDEYGSLKFPEVITSSAGGPSQKVILPECGHVPHKEQMPAVLNAVSDFLKNLD